MSTESRRQAKAKRRRDRKGGKARADFRVIGADPSGAISADFSRIGEFEPDEPVKIATMNMGSPVYGDGSNPGSGGICDSCGTAFYIDGMLPSVSVLNSSDTPVEHLIGPCPECDGLGTAVMHVSESESGRIFATHPVGILLAAQITQALLEDGRIAPEEAANRLRHLAPLKPLVDWIDENANRLGLILGALGLVLTGVQMLDDDGITDKQIERIVRSVVDQMEDLATPPMVDPGGAPKSASPNP